VLDAWIGSLSSVSESESAEVLLLVNLDKFMDPNESRGFVSQYNQFKKKKDALEIGEDDPNFSRCVEWIEKGYRISTHRREQSERV